MVEILEEFRDLPMDEFVNVGDLVTCLSEIDYGDDKAGRDLRFHLTGLLIWAIGKRSVSEDAIIANHKAKVLSLQDAIDNDVVWLEHKGSGCNAASCDRVSCSMSFFNVMCSEEQECEMDSMYGVQWRCWDACPTYEQRKETVWSDRSEVKS